MNIQTTNNLIQESKSLVEAISQQPPSNDLDVRIADFLKRVRPFAVQTIESPAKQTELKESLETLRTTCSSYKPISSNTCLLTFIKPLLTLARKRKQTLLLHITAYFNHKEVHAWSAVCKDQRIIATTEKIRRLHAGISANELGLTEQSLIKLLKTHKALQEIQKILQKPNPDFPILAHLNLSKSPSFNLESIVDGIPSTITHLTARNCSLSFGQVQQIVNSPNLTNLINLDLRDNWIGSIGAEVIANSPMLTNLSSLNLRDNLIGSEGAIAIANSPHLTNLSNLNLRDNLIKSEGAIAIANSLMLPNLTSLNLRENLIESDGAIAIGNSPNLANLRSLNLKENLIKSDGALAIENFPSLTNLRKLKIGGFFTQLFG